MSVNKEDIVDAFLFRHACKEFDAERKISDEDFNLILETARLSPSSFGLEPWLFWVIQNPSLRDKIKNYTWGAQKQLPTASHVVLALVRKTFFMRYDSEYVKDFMSRVQHFPEEIIQMRLAVLEKFQREDFRLLDSERAMTDWAGKQSYLALANMMTVAAMRGIDSCPIEGFQHAELERLLAHELEINLDHWGLGYLVAFGYRKTPPTRPKTRQESEAIIKWYP